MAETSWTEIVDGTPVRFVEANMDIESYPPNALACEFQVEGAWKRCAVRVGNPDAYDRKAMRKALAVWLEKTLPESVA